MLLITPFFLFFFPFFLPCNDGNKLITHLDRKLKVDFSDDGHLRTLNQNPILWENLHGKTRKNPQFCNIMPSSQKPVRNFVFLGPCTYT